MRRAPARWALSPLDCQVHLLVPSGEQDTIVALKARCGTSLPGVAIQHDQPPPGPPCEACTRVFLAEFTVSR